MGNQTATLDYQTALSNAKAHLVILGRELTAWKAYVAALEGLGEFEGEFTTWKVESRSFGKPHQVRSNGKIWTCTCKAGENGRECWALKGLREAKAFGNPALSVRIYDYDNYRYRDAIRLT